MKTRGAGLSLLASAVWMGAVMNFSGWLLSSLGHLERSSYLISLGVAIVVVFFLVQKAFWFPFFSKCIRRLRRPIPAAFAFVSLLVLVGALLYPPSNYDALSYRIPRVMHWLSEKGWLWIPTANARQNYSGVGQEWLLAPLIVIFKTDRFLFLPNWGCFLLLPSVFFRLLRGVGCSRRSSWFWMWLLPLAPIFVLQAGGIGNDLLGAFWFLGALALLPGHALVGFSVGWSLVAIALSTGVKASNLVLLLPWTFKFLSETRHCLALFRPALLALPLALAVSFAPTAFLNDRHTGDWSGDPVDEGKMKSHHFFPVLAGNAALVLAANLEQPVDFGACRLMHSIVRAFPKAARDIVRVAYPRWSLSSSEFSIEENAAWGWPLALFGLGTCLFFRHRRTAILWTLTLAAWTSAVVMMGKLSSEALPRLLAPLYPIMLLPLWGTLKTRTPFSRWATLSLFILLVPPLLLSPSRPLIPWNMAESLLTRIPAGDRWSSRIHSIRCAYDQRAAGLRPLILEELSGRFLNILLISNSNDTEGPLWWPYGKRLVQSRQIADRPPISSPDLILIRKKDWSAWSARWGIAAKERSQISLSLLAKVGPETWLALEPSGWAKP